MGIEEQVALASRQLDSLASQLEVLKEGQFKMGEELVTSREALTQHVAEERA